MTNYQQYGGQEPQPPGFPQHGPQQHGGQQHGPQGYGGQQGLAPAFPQQVYGQQYGVPQQAGFGWGPQFGQGTGMQSGPGLPPGPGWQRPPRKKGNTGLVVSLLALGLVLVGGVAVLLANLTGGDDDPVVTRPAPTVSEGPTPGPTYEPSTVPTQPTASISRPTTRPTGRPTARPTTRAPQPTRTTPRPTPRVPTDREVVTRDGFYFTGLHRSVGCRESSARQQNIRTATLYIGQIKKCLDRAWPRQVAAGRDSFRQPNIIVMNGTTGTNPCGGGSAFRSFYCPMNHTIYMDALSGVRDYNRMKNWPNRTSVLTWLRMRTSQTMAHEYGHHLQQITGILDAYYDLRYDQPTYAARLELNRRMELQASCFAAVFMGANKASYPITGRAKKEWDYLVIHLGDEYDTERTHGSRIVHSYWAQRGFNSRNNAMCNTFTASAQLVR